MSVNYHEGTKLYSATKNVTLEKWGTRSCRDGMTKIIIDTIIERSQYMSQQAVAEEMGISYSSLRNWLWCRSPIGRQSYKKIKPWLEKFS